MSRSSVALTIGWVLSSLVSAIGACGSDAEGGGPPVSGGVDAGALASAACDRRGASGCPLLADCEPSFVSSLDEATLFGCGASYLAYLKCLGEHDWVCTSVAGLVEVNAPAECEDALLEQSACGPYCEHSASGGTCSASCTFNGETIELSCVGGPSACQCTTGPKSGTAVVAESCARVDVLAALNVGCR